MSPVGLGTFRVIASLEAAGDFKLTNSTWKSISRTKSLMLAVSSSSSALGEF